MMLSNGVYSRSHGRLNSRRLLYLLIIVIALCLGYVGISIRWDNLYVNHSKMYEARIDSSSFEAITNANHSNDMSEMRNAHPSFQYASDSIPLLSVFTRTGVAFLERFIRSIDHPLDTLLVVQDTMEDLRVVRVLQNLRHDPHVLKNIKNIRHIVNIKNSGCAQAWNTVLRLYPGEPFWIFAANDIQLPPGQLHSFYMKTLHISLSEPSVGMISPAIDFGSSKPLHQEFSMMFWASTRQGVLTAGLFDENFFPGYFEDDDIIWRHFLSGMETRLLKDIVVKHGMQNGKYLSGTIIEDSQRRFVHEVRRSTNRLYLQHKWGPRMIGGVRESAKRLIAQGIEMFKEKCGRQDEHRGFFCYPFNNSNHDVRHWKFHQDLRDCIQQDEVVHEIFSADYWLDRFRSNRLGTFVNQSCVNFLKDFH